MKKFVAIAIAVVFGFLGLSLPATVSAANDICSQPNVPKEVKAANGCAGAGNQADISEVVIGIINGVVGSLALVAVIFIVVGGVNYMTSAGDSGKIQKAKNTILYAVIGLVICVLAFAIVNFVIANVIKSNSGNSTNTSIISTHNIA